MKVLAEKMTQIDLFQWNEERILRLVTILTHLSSVWLDDAAEPVQRHAHDGQRGHEGRHAGEGLDQAGKQEDHQHCNVKGLFK